MKYWIPTALWMVLIFAFSSRPRFPVSDSYAVSFVIFKSLHMLEYGILFLLFYRSLKNTRKAPQWQNLYDAWLLAVTYGITDEVHQMFIPTREGRIRDMFIDAFGISLVTLYIWRFLPRAPKKLKNWAKKLQLV